VRYFCDQLLRKPDTVVTHLPRYGSGIRDEPHAMSRAKAHDYFRKQASQRRQQSSAGLKPAQAWQGQKANKSAFHAVTR
jgi:hypothetical protein